MIRLTHKDLQHLKVKQPYKVKKEQPDEYMFVSSPYVKSLLQTWTFLDEIDHENHNRDNKGRS